MSDTRPPSAQPPNRPQSSPRLAVDLSYSKLRSIPWFGPSRPKTSSPGQPQVPSNRSSNEERDEKAGEEEAESRTSISTRGNLLRRSFRGASKRLRFASGTNSSRDTIGEYREGKQERVIDGVVNRFNDSLDCSTLNANVSKINESSEFSIHDFQCISPDKIEFLDLQKNPLKIINNYDLLNLTNLKQLILRDCQLLDCPGNLFRLPNLDYMDIGNNYIGGLPKDYIDSKIKRLEMNENQFCSGIPSVMFQNKNLQHLNCSNNTIYDTISRISIDNTENLEHLELHSCYLSNIHPLTIIRSLKHLDVSGNMLTVLPESIKNWKSLEILILSENNIVKITDAIGELQNLVELDLSYNKICYIPNSLKELRSLKSLELNSNDLNFIPKSFGCLKSLYKLNISENKIAELPIELENLTNLEDFDSSNNLLMDQALKPVCKMKNLRVLKLKSNCITHLPKQLCKLEYLEELYCDSNKISKIDEDLMFQSLIFLNLSKNNIVQVPECLKSSKKLQYLILIENEDNTYSHIDNPTYQKSSILKNFAPKDVTKLCTKRRVTFEDPNIFISCKHTLFYHKQTIKMHIVRELSPLLGISICGGRDSVPFNNTDHGIYVISINDNSDLYSKGIRTHDKIVSVNNHSLKNIKHKKAINIFSNLGSSFDIEISPKIDSCLDIVELDKRNEGLGTMLSLSRDIEDFPFGFIQGTDKLVEGIYVVKILEETPADRSENLHVGDRIIAVNGRSMENLTLERVMGHFRDLLLCDTIFLSVQHFGPPPGYEIIHIVRDSSEETFGLKLIGGTEYPFYVNNNKHSGIYIQEVMPNSGLVRFKHKIMGCQILTIDNTSILGVTRNFTLNTLSKCSRITQFTICSGIDINQILETATEVDSECEAEINDKKESENASNHQNSGESQDLDHSIDNFSYFLNEFSTMALMPYK